MDGVSQCVLVVVGLSPLKPSSLMAFYREVYIRRDTVFDSLMTSMMCLAIYLCLCRSLLMFWNCIYVIRTDVEDFHDGVLLHAVMKNFYISAGCTQSRR